MKNNKLHIIYATLEAILCILLIAYAIYIYNKFYVCYVFEGAPPFNKTKDSFTLVSGLFDHIVIWTIIAIVMRTSVLMSRTKKFTRSLIFSTRWYNIAALLLFFFLLAITFYMFFRYGTWTGCDLSIPDNYEYFSWQLKDLLIVPLVITSLLAIVSIPDYIETKRWYEENCKDEKGKESKWNIIGVIGLIVGEYLFIRLICDIIDYI